MADRPGRELALLGALVAIGVVLPSAVFMVSGSSAAWAAGLVIAGAVGGCYHLATAAMAAPPPSLIAGGLLIASAAAGLRSMIHQLLATRRGIKPLQEFARPSPRLERACRRAGVQRRIVGEVLASVPTSFCYGILRRRILVTSALADVLDDDELAAVIRHEQHHSQYFDPARMLLARAAAAAFFWLPLTRDLRDRYLVAKELAADRAAVALLGPGPFGSALLKMTVPGPIGTAAFGSACLERRVDALLGEPQPPIPLSPQRVRGTVVSVLGAVGLVGWAFISRHGAHRPSDAGLAEMLRSPSIHGSAGMSLLAALNLGILLVCGRVLSQRRGASRARA